LIKEEGAIKTQDSYNKIKKSIIVLIFFIFGHFFKIKLHDVR